MALRSLGSERHKKQAASVALSPGRMAIPITRHDTGLVMTGVPVHKNVGAYSVPSPAQHDVPYALLLWSCVHTMHYGRRKGVWASPVAARQPSSVARS